MDKQQVSRTSYNGIVLNNKMEGTAYSYNNMDEYWMRFAENKART